MADNKLSNAQSVSIDEVTIYPLNGQELLVKEQVIELNYFEDLYGFVASGFVTLSDTQGLVERWELLNLCKIKINFGRIKGASENVSGFFILYAFERQPTGSTQEDYLKLYFCSEELILSQKFKIQRGAPKDGEEIHKTVEYILKEQLKIQKPIDIERTSGIQNLNIDTKSAFEALNWLASRARPLEQKLTGADMIFFENKYGFNFKSLRSLMAKDTYNYYNYNLTNVNTDIAKKTHDILQLKFVRTFNALDAIGTGAFANRLISVDPLTRSYKVTNFDYNKYIAENKPSDGNSLINDDKDRLGHSLNENSTSVVRVVVANSDQYKVKYINDIPGSVANDIMAENFIPNRNSEITLANFILLKVSVPGDPNLTVGLTVKLNLYSLGQNGKKRELDKIYSGKYLVNAVRHVLQPSNGMYQTFMELAKDSYSTKLESSTGVK